MTRPVDAAGFEEKFVASDDPWACRSSKSERLKRRRALSGVPLVSNALDVACGDGAGTRDIASRALWVSAVDRSDAALASAARLLSENPRVSFLKARLPAQLPNGLWRRIVVAEVIYYLNPYEINALAVALARRVSPGGSLISIHHVVAFDDARTPPSWAERLFHERLGRRLIQRSAERYGWYFIRRYLRLRT